MCNQELLSCLIRVSKEAMPDAGVRFAELES